MDLHDNKIYFEAAINACSQLSGVSRAIIEKDYYVTLVLNELSRLQQNTPVFFKGGTALYKALKSIRRFSEDIDLTVRVNDCPSPNQAKKRLELVSSRLKSLPRDRENPANENKRGTITAIYSYETFLPQIINDELQRFGFLQVEATSFTVSEPIQLLEVEPILYTLATDDIKKELSMFNVVPFKIGTIALERIFADKILAAEFYAEREKYFDVAKHSYDLCVMMQLTQIRSLLKNDDEFIKMLSFKRMEENVRIGSNLATKPLDQVSFFDLLSSGTFVSNYENMQKIYVFNEKDKISHSVLLESLSFLRNYLCSISKKEQHYLNSIEYRTQRANLLSHTQELSNHNHSPSNELKR